MRERERGREKDRDRDTERDRERNETEKTRIFIMKYTVELYKMRKTNKIKETD